MGRRPGLGKETSTSSGFPERHSSVIAPAGHHCNVRSGHLNATFGGKDMGSMAQTGLLLVPSDALGHTWALPGVLGAGRGLPPETGPRDLKTNSLAQHWARDWRALALTQVHHGSRLSDSCEDGEALSSVHSTALAAGKLIHNLLCDGRVKND